jgi:hypothetical protein
MEVHHHPHVERKSFKEYFLEGLMIFMAVTLGFIAENIRENISENHKAKELAESLYQEVYADSIDIHKKMETRITKEKQLNYFIDFVRDSSLSHLSDRFYKSFAWSTLIISPTLFEPADGMLNQLRNSGSLRYFKNNEIQAEIGQLSVSIARIRSRAEIEATFGQEYLRPLIMKFYDFQWNDEITNHGNLSIADAVQTQPTPSHQPKLQNEKAFSRSEAVNIASYYRLIISSTRLTQFKSYAETNHKLLQSLRAEYDLK